MRTPQRTEAERFNLKAHRIARALAMCPTARQSELVTFLDKAVMRIMNGNLGSIADMMCGTGYLANALPPPASKLVLVEASSGMLEACNPDLRSKAIIVMTAGGFAEQNISKHAPYDLITCLAGLHHVFVNDGNGHVDRSRSVKLQAQTIKRWTELLADGGEILIADVAEDSAVRLWDNTTYHCGEAVKPSPARYFDDFVAQHSLVGHQAQFMSVDLVDDMRSMNLECSVSVIYTPWRFRSKREAAWYFGEKFAVGSEVLNPSQLSRERENLLLGGLEKYLGINRDQNMGEEVGWRLAYLTVSRKTRGEKEGSFNG